MGVFDMFRRSKITELNKTKAIPYDIQTWKYRSFDAAIVEMDLIRACIDALARNVAKLDLKAVIHSSDGTKKVDYRSDVARVLRRPNQYMSTYDFLYKIAAYFFATNNALIYPEYDANGNLIALHPISYSNFELKKSANGILIAKFSIGYMTEYTVPYSQLIHLRNHYITDDLLGDSNSALVPVTELLNAQNQGIINGIKNSAIIRGILKAAGVIKQQDLQKAKEQFIEDNLNSKNNGGVIALDGKFDYTQLDSKPYLIDAETMEQAKAKVFNYFGVNEAFLQNTFTAEQYEAVYEGRLEPFAIMFCQAMTHGLYTERERGFGNEIEAAMSKLKYQPIAQLANLISVTNQLGLFRRDEFRGILGFEPLGPENGGNDIMVSLNYQNETQEGVKDDESED